MEVPFFVWVVVALYGLFQCMRTMVETVAIDSEMRRRKSETDE